MKQMMERYEIFLPFIPRWHSSLRKVLGALLFFLLLASCTSDSYEKGTGQYSLMRADLGEMRSDADSRAVSFTTDDGDVYSLTSPMALKWMTTPDSIYRVQIYYNKVSDDKAEAVGVGLVPTMRPIEHWRIKNAKEDPVDVESAWVAKSKRYLNLGLLFKTGRIDDEEGVHGIGIVQDTVLVSPGGKRTACYRFLHDQGDTPEYYTNRHFVSILLPDELPDTVKLGINTYQGIVEQQFALQ